MKKYIVIIPIIIFTLVVGTTNIYARAGGGGSSGSSSGSSSGGTSSSTTSVHSSTHHRNYSDSNSNPIIGFVNYIAFIFIAGFSAIIFRFKIMKAKRHSKQIMNLLDDKDEAWKYKNIQKQVKETYYIIQKAWTNQNMESAKEYMEESLYESFQTKLQWMEIKKQRNILKKISLIEAIPVSIYDDKDDKKDYIWYYIKGSMVDYIIDTETNLKIEGTNLKTRFVEYWKFTRKDNTKWVLSEILQEDEGKQMIFQDEINKLN